MTGDRTLRGMRQAAEMIGRADALLITAGAGMGVDSGLPDFRGNHGFWRAYPPLERLGISFEEMAQPHWFEARPELAWAFYGHRQRLYRKTKPHDGFRLLLEWGRAMPLGYFAVTSNVDGHFEAAGFEPERILELHGNIHALQCTRPCREATWRDAGVEFDIDEEALQARGGLPRCPHCSSLARPNVLMFGDGQWVSTRTGPQHAHFQGWLAATRGCHLVIVELGAGTAIPTVRRLGERLAAEWERTTLVRINPLASASDEGSTSVRAGALEALRQIDAQIGATLRARALEHVVDVPDVAVPASQVVGRGPDGLPTLGH